VSDHLLKTFSVLRPNLRNTDIPGVAKRLTDFEITHNKHLLSLRQYLVFLRSKNRRNFRDIDIPKALRRQGISGRATDSSSNFKDTSSHSSLQGEHRQKSIASESIAKRISEFPDSEQQMQPSCYPRE
jgi:hypothetical protein